MYFVIIFLKSKKDFFDKKKETRRKNKIYTKNIFIKTLLPFSPSLSVCNSLYYTQHHSRFYKRRAGLWAERGISLALLRLTLTTSRSGAITLV